MTDDLTPFVNALVNRDWSDIPGKPPPPKPEPVAVEEAPKTTLPDPEPFDSWADEIIAMPEYCIDGILPVGAKMMLSGGSKSYKTWQLIDLALALSSGSPWMGFATRPSRVLYIDLEFIPAFFKKRVQAVAKAKGIPPNPNLDVWHLRGKMYDPRVILEVMSTFGKGYEAIIIDPFYKMNAGGDENSNAQVTEVLLMLEKFAEKSALIVSHHHAKGDMTGRDAIDRTAGAGAFGRDPDTCITCTRHEVDNGLTLELAVRNDKPVPKKVVVFNSEKLCMEEQPDLDPNKLHKPGQKFKTLEEALAECSSNKTLEALAKATPKRPHSRHDLQRVAEDLGWTRHEFDQAISDESERAKWFMYEAVGRATRYTPK